MRKDSILQQYYYKKLPKYQDKGQVTNQYGIPSARELAQQNMGYSSDAQMMAKQQADARAAELKRKMVGASKESFVLPARQSTAYDEKMRQIRNQTYASQNAPYSRIDDKGNLSRLTPNVSMTGTPDPRTPEARWQKGSEHMMNAMEVAGALQGVGAFAKGLRASARQIAKPQDVFWNGRSYQTTPLSNPTITRGPIPNPYPGTTISGRISPNVVGKEIPEELRAFNIRDLNREQYNKFMQNERYNRWSRGDNPGGASGFSTNTSFNDGQPSSGGLRQTVRVNPNVSASLSAPGQRMDLTYGRPGDAVSFTSKKSLPNKSIIRDDELLGSMPENKYNELINKTKAQAKRNIDRIENIGKDIEAGEYWKFTPEEIKKFKVQKELSDEMRIGSDYHPEVSINLQNVNPDKIFFENLPQQELKSFGITPFGAQWKSGQSSTYSKADLAKFKTFDEFLANQKLLQGKEFQGQFTPYKMSAFDLIKLNKNKEGGIIEDNRGQWAHPGKNTRVFSPSITMDGVPYPVEARANTGQKVIMQPGQDYYFPGADYVDEYPILPKAQVGKQKGNAISNWWYNTDDVQSTYKMAPEADPFLVNWLQHPETQRRLKENIESTSYITGNVNPNTITKEALTRLNKLPMFSRELVKKTGISLNDIKYNNELQGWKTVHNYFGSSPYYSADFDQRGVYYPDYHTSMVNTFNDPGTIIHEQTHGTGPFQKTMEDVIWTKFYNKKNPEKRFVEQYGAGLSKYDPISNTTQQPTYNELKNKYPGIYGAWQDTEKYLDKDGMYPRIMEIRRMLNLKPGQKVNKSMLQQDGSLYTPVNDLRHYYDDDTIVEMLNTLAKNNPKKTTASADYVDEYPMMQRGGVPQSTSWQPLTPEIARGRYSGDIEGMVYRETGDPNNPYNITVGDIPEPKQEPKLTYRKPQKIETQRLTPSLQLLNRPNSRIDIPLPERGKYAVEYYDPNEPGGVQGGWHSEKFRTPSEADAFMEQRNKEGKFQGSSMQRRMLEYGGLIKAQRGGIKCPGNVCGPGKMDYERKPFINLNGLGDKMPGLFNKKPKEEKVNYVAHQIDPNEYGVFFLGDMYASNSNPAIPSQSQIYDDGIVFKSPWGINTTSLETGNVENLTQGRAEYGGPLVEYYKGKMTGPNMFQDGGGLKPYEGYSVVDFLAAQNKPYSYKSRKELAQQAGIKNYRGRAEQNINLINLIKQNPNLIGYNQPTTQKERFLGPAGTMQIPRSSYTAPIPSSLSIPSASAYNPQYSEIIPRPPVEEEQKVLGRPAPLQLEKSSYIAPGFPSSFTRSYTPQYDKPIPAPSFEEEMPVLKGVGSLSPIESLRPSTAVTMPSYIPPGIQGRPNYTNIPLPPAPAKKVTPVKTSKAIASNVSDSMDNILAKQAYKESTWRPGVINKKGYKGLAQLGEAAIQDYKRLTGDTDVDPLNPAHAVKVQRFLMNELYNSSFINKPNQSEQVRKAKALAAYNWGRGSLSGYLNKMKKRGVDIYNSLDWMKNLPGETIDYINKILLNTSPQFDADYKKAVSNPGNEQIRKLYNVNYKKGGQSNEGYYNYNYNVPEFGYGGYLPKAQEGRVSDAANTSSKNRKCGITAANDKEYKECLKEERKEDKVFYKQVAAEEDAMLKQKAQEWADYTNTGLDAYGTKYGKKDKTFQEAFNTFVTANPTFSQQQTTSGLTPEQQYAMFYKMAGRSGSPTYQATGRLKTYMGVDPTQRFTDKQLYEAVNKMGGIDKYIDWYKAGWPEIPKQSYGGDISIPQLPDLQGPLLQYYYSKGGEITRGIH